eukprot:1830124-Lingulodinium_polyedra.AAC.1
MDVQRVPASQRWSREDLQVLRPTTWRLVVRGPDPSLLRPEPIPKLERAPEDPEAAPPALGRPR